MAKEPGQSNRYTLAFKLHAIRKLEMEGKSPTQVASELGLPHRNLLYSWRKQKDKLNAIHAQAKRPQLHYHSELSLLQNALKRMTAERDILKKAKSYFGKLGRRGTNSYVRPERKNP